MDKNRDTFNSRLGFILACVGSAVGMANIWLFPYRLGQFGGAAFLIPYLFFVVIIGYSGVIGEMAFGRAMGTGPLGAFRQAVEKRGKKFGEWIGLIPVIGSLGIAIGYAVVVGWILRFLVGSLTGAVLTATDSGAYFGEIAGTFGSWPWHLIGLGLTFGIMIFGISKGIEKVNKVMMPAFFDTCAGLLAALVIIPAVFAFGFDPAAGPPLMFITMPEVFKQMPMGQLFAIIFFVAVLFAGITSLMNLFETPIEALQEKFKLSRGTSVAIIAAIAVCVGVMIENGDVVGTWMDVVSIYVIPLGALLAGIMFFWVCGSKFAREQAQLGREKVIGKWFEPVTRYVFCGLTIIVYILGIFYGGIG